jgi:uncharacterized protein YoaH (UPF0181 family)
VKRLRPSGGLTALVDIRPALTAHVSVSGADATGILRRALRRRPARKSELTLTAVECNVLEDLLDGKVKRPAHRPASMQTYERQRAISIRIRELMCEGNSQEGAIRIITEEFRCDRRTVMRALKR